MTSMSCTAMTMASRTYLIALDMRGHADLVDHCRDLALKRLRLVLALLAFVDRAAHLV